MIGRTTIISETLIKIKNIIDDQNNLSYFNLHFRRFVETLELLIQNQNLDSVILDVGSSPGYLLMATKQLGYKVIGIDLDPNYIDKNIRDDLVVKKCDLEKDKLPFNDETFDCILFTEVAEHLLYYNLKPVLIEIRRVLKRDGLIILTTPNIAALENRIFLLFGKEVINYMHNREYTRKEISTILVQSGFSIKQINYSLSRDVVTHKILDNFISEDHVLIGSLKYPFWKNIGRAIVLPIKLLVPSFRSSIFIIGNKKLDDV